MAKKEETKKVTKKTTKKESKPEKVEKKTTKASTRKRTATKKESIVEKRNETVSKSMAIVIIFTVLCLILVVLASMGKHPTNKITENDYVYLGTSHDIETDGKYNNYVFNNFDDYNKKIGIKLKESDFEEHNYVFFTISYDSCSEKNITPKKYSMHGNNITVTIDYESQCGVCAPEELYYLLKLDKSITDASVELNFNVVKSEECDPMIAYKPIIYLYPEKEMNVSVKLLNDYNLTTTYPKYQNEWNVYAYPNGNLIDNNTGRSLYALYWEGDNHQALVKEDGFVVKKEDTITFLEEKLALLGLNEREADEFIIYWLPKMEHNTYNYIRFETIEEINNYMPLEVSPNPDTIIRVQMDFKGLNEIIEVAEQKIVTPERIGFTVVEWGGSVIK